MKKIIIIIITFLLIPFTIYIINDIKDKDVFPEESFTTIESDSSFIDLNNNSFNDVFSTNLFEEMPFLLDFDNELPNGVANKIRYDNGSYVFDRYVQEVTLTSAMITSLNISSYINIDFVNIEIGSIFTNWVYNGVSVSSRTESTTLYSGFVDYFGIVSTYDDVSNVNKNLIRLSSSNILSLALAKGTYATLAEVQVDLAGTKIWYQLATPIVTEFDYMFYSPLYQSTFDLLTEEQIKLQMDEFIEKPYLFIDYETLGIDNITTAQMDMYYSYYLNGFDNVTFGNTVSAYTNLQSLMSQNADLNYKLYIKDLSTDIKNIQNTQYKLTQNDDNILVSDINDEYLMTIYDDDTYISNISIDNLEFTFEGYNSIGTIQGTIPTIAQPFLLIIPLFLIVGFIFLVIKEE